MTHADLFSSHVSRLQAILDREPVDRLAVDLWYTPEVGEALRRHTGTESDLEMCVALGLDKIVWVFPSRRDAMPDRTSWGVPLRPVQAGKARYEEGLLRARYPEYPDYQRRSWGVVPGWGRRREP